jgi:hypothetical protein
MSGKVAVAKKRKERRTKPEPPSLNPPLVFFCNIYPCPLALHDHRRSQVVILVQSGERVGDTVLPYSVVMNSDGRLTIGCETRELSDWMKNRREIAKKHAIGGNHYALYTAIIRTAYKRFQEFKDAQDRADQFITRALHKCFEQELKPTFDLWEKEISREFVGALQRRARGKAKSEQKAAKR